MIIKELILTPFILQGCGGLNRTDFFYNSKTGECVMVLTKLIFYSFYCGRVW